MVAQPRGVRDFGPSEAIARKEIISIVEEVFKRFGFYPLETPSMESMSVLSTKAYGEDATGELFKIENDDSALRFDLTVPMARYIAMNKSIPLPFKRYQIGYAWRRDEPQKMRYREFLQADVDIVGSKEVASDAEIIAAIAASLDDLGIKNYMILLNNRVILDRILDFFKIPNEKHNAVMRVIDKLDKVTSADAVSQMGEVGVDDRTATKLIEFIKEKGANDEKIARVAANVDGTKEEVGMLNNLMQILKTYGIADKVQVDLSLARGLAYYTGFVFEFVAFENNKKLPTLAAGGRYDNLIGMYAKQNLPAVGCSIGIDRLFEIVEGKPLINTYAKLFVAYIKNDDYPYALEFATKARAAGIYADIEMMNRNISKQLEHANALKFKYAAIVGAQERSNNKVKLRDLVSGNEVLLGVDEAIKTIKERYADGQTK